MQLTVRDVVVTYMERTSGFPIDSITDLDESMQVASVARDVFYEFLQLYPNLAVQQKDRTLDSLGDSTRPNYLVLPDKINNMRESVFYYNIAEGGDETVSYKRIHYVTPLEFLERTAHYSDQDPDTEVVTGLDGVKMVVLNDTMPDFFTSFDDKHLVFNSYDSSIDTTLQASKSRVVSNELPVWVMEDDFLIPIPDHLTSTYLNMVLDQAYNDIRQERNALIAQKARRDRIKLQQDSARVGSGGRTKKTYGRRGNIQTYGRARDYIRR